MQQQRPIPHNAPYTICSCEGTLKQDPVSHGRLVTCASVPNVFGKHPLQRSFLQMLCTLTGGEMAAATQSPHLPPSWSNSPGLRLDWPTQRGRHSTRYVGICQSCAIAVICASCLGVNMCCLLPHRHSSAAWNHPFLRSPAGFCTCTPRPGQSTS